MSQNPNGLLEYIPGSQALLVQKNSSPPLEGFAENIRESIHDYAEDSKSEVEKGTKTLPASNRPSYQRALLSSLTRPTSS